MYWADHLFPLNDFYKLGIKPQTIEGIKGIFLMPLVHSRSEIEHIVNNSVPTAILLGTLIYYYRVIAFRVFVFSWLFTGICLWAMAGNEHSYHIGMSGVIYALAGFLFTSGVVRRFLPLQGISLFVAFVYGSMIWGIFPIQPHVSWQGHLAGLIVGVLLAILYRNRGPQAPKYQYEIEKELGIEPPDLEGDWKRRVEEYERHLATIEAARLQIEEEPKTVIKYHYIPETNSRNDNDAPKSQ